AATGEADIAVTTHPAELFPDLLLLDYCKLPRALLMPRGHPLASESRITLKAISQFPLITLDAGSLGQSNMQERFRQSGLTPRLVFTGVDVDAVKAFVESGIGIAVVPAISYDQKRDPGLHVADVSHLFDPHSGCLGLRRNHYLRGYAFDFIEMLAPQLNRRRIQQALDSGRASIEV
ncbi:MAG TPA: LysR substrate-binding domain-containing protein, partial [Burkholderiales bacterium]|nr:LysR substrate-binding domain-containing protein [Burkholderiales bacterium]